LASLAEVWWRQHQRLGPSIPFMDITSEEREVSEQLHTQESPLKSAMFSQVYSERDQLKQADYGDNELEGFELRKWLPNASALHQLLFSSMMLHWNLHAPLPRSQRIGLSTWLGLNRGIAGGGLPESIQTPIYNHLSNAKVPQLWFGPQPVEPQSSTTGEESAVAGGAVIEGWARIVGDGLPVLLGVGSTGVSGTPAAECLHVSSMLSETTASSRRRHPDPRVNQRPVPVHATSLSLGIGACGGGGATASRGRPPTAADSTDAVWLSLCPSLLFLSTGPVDTGTPFAFVSLCEARFMHLDPKTGRLVLQGQAKVDTMAPLRSSSSSASGAASQPPPGQGDAGSKGADMEMLNSHPLQLVLLLQDGRWQSYDLPRLVVEVCDSSALDNWVTLLMDACAPTAT